MSAQEEVIESAVEKDDLGDADPVNERIRNAAVRFAHMHLVCLKADEDKTGQPVTFWSTIVSVAGIIFSVLPELMAIFSFYSICQSWANRTPQPDPSVTDTSVSEYSRLIYTVRSVEFFYALTICVFILAAALTTFMERWEHSRSPATIGATPRMPPNAVKNWPWDYDGMYSKSFIENASSCVTLISVYIRYGSLIQVIRVLYSIPRIAANVYHSTIETAGKLRGEKDQGLWNTALAWFGFFIQSLLLVIFLCITTALGLLSVTALLTKLAATSGTLGRNIRTWEWAEYIMITQITLNIISLADTSKTVAAERRNAVVTAIIGVCYDNNEDVHLNSLQWARKVMLFDAWLLAGYLREKPVYSAIWLAQYTPWTGELIRKYDFPKYNVLASTSADRGGDEKTDIGLIEAAAFAQEPKLESLSCFFGDTTLVDNFLPRGGGCGGDPPPPVASSAGGDNAPAPSAV